MLKDQILDDRAKELFLNFDTAKQWYRNSLINNPCTSPPDPDYAVITTENTFLNSGTLDDFCFHKEDLGFEVMVVTAHQVRNVDYDPVAGYSFSITAGGYEDVVGAPAPNQRPEKLRKWLRDNYLALGLEYILLIGNPDPDNRGEGDTIGDLPMKDYQLHLFADVPTDFYFAELSEATWDLDGDGYVGEYYAPVGSTNLAPAVTSNLFCVCWDGVLEITGAAGDVFTSFQIASDGQMNIWLDQDLDGITNADLIFSDPNEHWPNYQYRYINLSNGIYPIKIEYKQSGSDAYSNVIVKNYVDGVETILKHDDGTGTYVEFLEADFFNNNDFSGLPVAEWDDRTVYAYYATGDPRRWRNGFFCRAFGREDTLL